MNQVKDYIQIFEVALFPTQIIFGSRNLFDYLTCDVTPQQIKVKIKSTKLETSNQNCTVQAGSRREYGSRLLESARYLAPDPISESDSAYLRQPLRISRSNDIRGEPIRPKTQETDSWGSRNRPSLMLNEIDTP